MKIYKDLYWLIISPASLFRAWDIFKADKKNKPDVMDFELELEKNIFDFYRDLKNEIYRHGPYKGFWIHDPKLRRINKAIVRDRVLHHAIFSAINPIFEPTFISNSFSCCIGKGTHKRMFCLGRMLNKERRIFKKLTLKLEQYENGIIEKKTLKASLQSYLGALSHTNAHKLSENPKNYFLPLD